MKAPRKMKLSAFMLGNIMTTVLFATLMIGQDYSVQQEKETTQQTEVVTQMIDLHVRQTETEVTTTTTTEITATTTETTTSTTTEPITTTTTTCTTTKPVTTTEKTTTTAIIYDDGPGYNESITDELTFIGNYKGTYYPVKAPCYGGSGRILVDCGVNLNDTYKGSVASRYIYENYGYKVNGKTMVYLEIQEYSEMNGWYSVDDCNGNPKVIDFYFSDRNNCPFEYRGVVHVKAYMP